ncbi:MAG TPA: hypothetical protein VLF89_04405 [Candidatus Saccharimonadales bacterium]|nr:hypothetical protein [Candidatus Saccharimonadales bacterium]
MKDKAVEKTELVINALVYAQEHKLDINNKDSVRKILEVLDPAHSTEEEVEDFMKLLQDTDTFMEMTATRQNAKKTTLPN